ncbi:MAG: MYXO-CTERM sorting domain-containing protein [Polyangiaceae bacterium]
MDRPFLLVGAAALSTYVFRQSPSSLNAPFVHIQDFPAGSEVTHISGQTVLSGTTFHELGLTDGEACGLDPDCLSGHCVDGYCCDVACTGACERCDAMGSLGVCAPRGVGDPGSPSCAPYLCGATGECPGQCANDGGCAPGSFCSGGQCVPQAQPGEPCSGDNGCGSGHCVDGLCCASACGGTCEACDVAGHAGTCWPVPAGTDPAAECVGDDVCNGNGVCVSADGQICAGPGDCLSGHCVDGFCCDESCAGLCEACNIGGIEGICAPLHTGDDPAEECADGACNGAGQCELGLGEPCTSDPPCLSDHCVDGVCCDAVCGDGDASDCQACSVAMGATTDGLCGPLASGTVCREAAGVCDASEVCDGAAASCSEDAPASDGTLCDDGDPCTDGDACFAGACSPGAPSCGEGGAGGAPIATGGGGGEEEPFQVESGGCGCTVPGAPSRWAGHAWWLLAAGVVARRRRRRAGGRGREGRSRRSNAATRR